MSGTTCYVSGRLRVSRTEALYMSQLFSCKVGIDGYTEPVGWLRNAVDPQRRQRIEEHVDNVLVAARQ